jgi:hypothetical protein
MGERMRIPLVDRGNYYRGLLVLIRRDRVISTQERELMIRLGQALDFDKRFCENAIDDLLKNPHIKDRAIGFSEKVTAEAFLKDAILLALVDGELHPRELSWLKTVAAANGLDDKWLSAQITTTV